MPYIELNKSEIARYYASRVPRLKQRGKEWRGACPVHHGKNDNFAVNPETGQAHCHSACGRGWDVIGLEQELTGAAFPEAKAEVFAIVGKVEPQQPKAKREFDRAYDYTDENGELLYQVVRFKNPKSFSQRRPDGRGDWTWGLGQVQWVPYRLPALVAASTVFVVEGEKDADTLAGLGLTATCNNGGAGNFKPELVPYFSGKSVAIIPDNDEPGRKHAAKVAELLYGTAKSIKILELSGLAEKGDVSDFVQAGGKVDQLRAIYQQAPYYTPESQPHEEDQYLHSLGDEIADAGGVDAFWDLTRQKGVPTPFDRLTKALNGGLLPGEVYAIAARTGHGKTSLGLQFAIKALRANLGVVVFSMEMTWRAVFQRLVSIEARVDLNEFRYLQEHHKDTRDMVRELARYTGEFSGAPLWVSQKSRITPKYLLKEAERLRDKLPKLHLIVVDHMQLMGSDEKSGSEYEKFTAISRALKQTAKALNLPVLVMAQIKRLEDKGAELDISDIRGSGAIEEDLAGVMLIYEDKDDAKAAKLEERYAKGPVKASLKLAKNRFGSSGLYLDLLHFKKFTRFDAIEERA